MSPMTYLLCLASIVLASAAQTFLKMGVSTPAVKLVLTERINFTSLVVMLTSPMLLVGLLCFGLSVLLWLSVLARVPLSVAYPAVALGIVLTVLSSHFLLGETIHVRQIAGIVFIIGGVGLVTMGRV